jgi:ComF family protein
MYGHILQELADLQIMQNFNAPFLIPIPIDKSRKWERGFNQAELICKALVKIDENKNFVLKPDILIKIKDTGHQARIESRHRRLENIKNSFTINPNTDPTQEIKGKNIILLDDVTTTGATLSEAKKILKNAGARKVIAFTVAH